MIVHLSEKAIGGEGQGVQSLKQKRPKGLKKTSFQMLQQRRRKWGLTDLHKMKVSRQKKKKDRG